MAKIPYGYICKCSQEHKFDLYVYAHWDDKLTHRCGLCRRKNIIIRGKVRNMSSKKLMQSI